MTHSDTRVRWVPRPSSLAAFLGLAAIAILSMHAAHALFPGHHTGARWGRFACQSIGPILLILGGRWLMSRDGLRTDPPGLAIGSKSAAAFLVGAAIAAVHMVALLVGIYVVAPFELVRGSLPGSEVALAALGYLTGNFAEELLFRGYLLIVLARWLGTTRALWSLALPFGLFHFPGLDLLSLGKMMLTTGAMHFVYGYAYLATRSLWAAVALHAIGNTLLHSVVGNGRPAYLSFQYSREFPATVDAPFLIFLGVTAVLACVLAKIAAIRGGAAWIEGRAQAP